MTVLWVTLAILGGMAVGMAIIIGISRGADECDCYVVDPPFESMPAECPVHPLPTVDLDEFEVLWPEDGARINPDLVCLVCLEPLCEVEQEDTVLMLVAVCEAHVVDCEAR